MFLLPRRPPRRRNALDGSQLGTSRGRQGARWSFRLIFRSSRRPAPNANENRSAKNRCTPHRTDRKSPQPSRSKHASRLAASDRVSVGDSPLGPVALAPQNRHNRQTRDRARPRPQRPGFAYHSLNARRASTFRSSAGRLATDEQPPSGTDSMPPAEVRKSQKTLVFVRRGVKPARHRPSPQASGEVARPSNRDAPSTSPAQSTD